MFRIFRFTASVMRAFISHVFGSIVLGLFIMFFLAHTFIWLPLVWMRDMTKLMIIETYYDLVDMWRDSAHAS